MFATTFPSTYFSRTISYIPAHLMCIKVPVCILLGTKKFLTLWVGHYPTHLYRDSDDPAQRRIRTLSRKAREVPSPTPCYARVLAASILIKRYMQIVVRMVMHTRGLHVQVRPEPRWWKWWSCWRDSGDTCQWGWRRRCVSSLPFFVLVLVCGGGHSSSLSYT